MPLFLSRVPDENLYVYDANGVWGSVVVKALRY